MCYVMPGTIYVLRCRGMHIRFFITKVSLPVTSRLTTLVLFLITLSTPFMCFSVMYFCSYIRRTRQLDARRYQNLSIPFELGTT